MDTFDDGEGYLANELTRYNPATEGLMVLVEPDPNPPADGRTHDANLQTFKMAYVSPPERARAADRIGTEARSSPGQRQGSHHAGSMSKRPIADQLRQDIDRILDGADAPPVPEHVLAMPIDEQLRYWQAAYGFALMRSIAALGVRCHRDGARLTISAKSLRTPRKVCAAGRGIPTLVEAHMPAPGRRDHRVEGGHLRRAD